MSDTLVEIRNLSRIFSPKTPPALKGITTTIPKGKIIGLVGPDGAGKTTLMRLIAALLRPTQGTLSVAGHDTVDEPEMVHYLTGYMPQRFGLYEDLSVSQNLDLYADLKGVIGDERRATYAKLLKFTSLEPFTDRLAGALSGGMKQKLGLACALLKRPTLLLLDEPSVGVDPISRRELWKMVHELLGEGISILWSTAYLDEAQACDSVILLSEGALLYQSKPQELTERVEGRVFAITKIQGNQRLLLSRVLREENVIDGLIQGRDLRIVVREKRDPPLDIGHLEGASGVELKATPPRFEDAFIDLLGGGPRGDSLLAKLSPEVTTPANGIVVAEKLTKKFGAFVAADQISFSIQKGEIFGLLGPNGAGKSTTFKMMCGLLRPTEGKGYINGLDLQVAPGEARAHIGYMAQKFSLYGSLSVRQNLAFFSGIYNVKGKRQSEAIEQATEVFNLKRYLNLSAESLPLGYKQRLALACATMHHPDVLFLDEPTSGVDPITRREFWNHINGLVGRGVTVLVTTHFMDEAEYCDRIALIYRGKTIKIATPDELKEMTRSPEHPSPTLEDAFIKLIEEYDAQNVTK